MTKSLTAAELVKLARKVAPQVLTAFPEPIRRRVYVDSFGGWGIMVYAKDALPGSAVLWCLHDAENTASEEALTRALLASAIDAGRNDDGDTVAWVHGEPRPSHGSTFTANTEAEARDGLLDVLLSEAPQ